MSINSNKSKGHSQKSATSRAAQLKRAIQRRTNLYGNSLEELFAIRKHIKFTELGVSGPNHQTVYTFSVEVDGNQFIGNGQSRMEAKMHAASLALKSIDPSYEKKNLNLSEAKIIDEIDERMKKLNYRNDVNDYDRNRLRYRRYRESINRTRQTYGTALGKLENSGKKFRFSQLKPTEESKYFFSLKVDGKDFFGKGDSAIEAKSQASFEALQTIDGHELNVADNIFKENHNDLDDLMEMCPDIEFKLVKRKTIFSVSTQIDGKTFVGCGESYNKAKINAATLALKGIFLADDSGNDKDTNNGIQSFDHASVILSKILPKLEYKHDLKENQDDGREAINVVTVQIDELTFSAESEQREDAVNRVAATILKKIFNLVYEAK